MSRCKIWGKERAIYVVEILVGQQYKERDMQSVRMAVLVLCSSFPLATCAGDFLPTRQECHEASDFIEHAAMSRDNGYSKAVLVRRFDDDITVLSGMDPQKRWFVRSPGATRFLRDALVEVFTLRRKPKEQAMVFFRSCMAHVLAVTPDDL
jgi:galactokinase